MKQKNDPARLDDSLTEIAARLGNVGPRFEPAFIELGSQLQTAFQEADSLTQQTRRAVSELGNDDDGNLLLRVSRVADTAVEELDGYRRRMTLALSSLNDCIDHLNALFKQSGEIEKIALFLRVIGLNIGVESSRCEEGRSLFGVVAKDVVELSEKINETVYRLYEDSSSAIAVQRSAYRAVDGEFKRTGGLADNARKELEAAAAGVHRLMDGAKRAMQDAGRHSQVIVEQVGQIVAGIQFHDNMSQRLAHMTEALDNAVRLSRRFRDDSDDPSRAVSVVHAILMLQRAQLENVMLEAEAVHRKNEKAFSTIYDQIDELKRGLACFGRDEARLPDDLEDTRDGNHFGGLMTALENLDRLLRAGAPMIERVAGALGEAGRSAGRLSDHAEQVQQVSMSVHMIALNAIIKAAHMGENGLTLEVLAQEVRRLSREADDFVDTFQALAASTAETIGGGENAGAAGAESRNGSNSVEDQIRNGIEQIDEIRARFKADTDAALDAAEKLKIRVAAIQESLVFFADLHRTLQDHFDQLEAIAEELSRDAPEAVANDLNEATTLADRYTTDQERKVHSRLFVNEGESSPANADSLDDGESADESGMEFFEDFGDANAGDDNTCAGDIELFDDGDAKEVDTTGETPDDAAEKQDSNEKRDEEKSRKQKSVDDQELDLGDNIELF